MMKRLVVEVRSERLKAGFSLLSIALFALVVLPLSADADVVPPCPPALLSGGGASAQCGRGIDWSPGNYIMGEARRDGTPAVSWNKIRPGTTASNYFLGAKLYLLWGRIEESAGRYRWDIIDTHIANARAAGKKVVLGVHMVTFNHLAKQKLGCPADLEAQGHCWYQDANNPDHCDAGQRHLTQRHGPRIWGSQVAVNRAKAFYDALGARYNSNPTVAAVYAFNGESAVGVCNGKMKQRLSFDMGKYISARNQIVAHARTAFPNKVVLHGTNFDGDAGGPAHMRDYFEPMLANGVGAVGPDFFLPNRPPSDAQRLYPSYIDRIPLSFESQRATTLPGNPAAYYKAALKPSNGGQYGLNFLFWPTHWEGDPEWDFEDGIVRVVKSRIDSGDRLNSTCPSSFASRGGCRTAR